MINIEGGGVLAPTEAKDWGLAPMVHDHIIPIEKYSPCRYISRRAALQAGRRKRQSRILTGWGRGYAPEFESSSNPSSWCLLMLIS
eukprot:763026-Hanusia_phi.AAC.12